VSSAAPFQARVLVVDDEEGVRVFVTDALTASGHEVTQAADGVSALARMSERAFHLVITDLRMPGLDGLGVLTAVRRDHPETEVIVLTAHGSIESAVGAMKEGAFDFLQKPIGSPAELRAVVARAVERHRLRSLQEIDEQPEGPPLGYGAPAMQAVENALRKVAPTSATVLLLGESGTGKEVAARAVHRWSARAAGPFVAVNCAALSADLLESELFGYEKGAFTGAIARRRGRLELAEGGTFFLDEVGELAPPLQAKLLRVLQEKCFERVGGRQTVVADVRWVAATNRDLADMVKHGGFREDLYHRLALFPVELPPLRDRRADIGPLSQRLLSGIAPKLGRPDLRLAAETLAALRAAPWPGNVRQLANVLERSAILADRSMITPADLALLPNELEPATAGAPVTPTSMDALEKAAIEQALAATGGNRRLAAERLEIGLRTLYEKLKRYKIG